MTSTVKVTAHCSEDTIVLFGITTNKLPLEKDLMEVVRLESGETAEKYIAGDRIVVVLERKKIGLNDPIEQGSNKSVTS